MSFKTIWRVLLPLLGAWLLSATAANAMFLSTDPIGTKDDPNLYMYIDLDPVNRVDPLGLESVCAASTGSRIQSCVGVDGNGDGNVKDDDLTNRQSQALSRDFRSFIVNNNGRNLGSFGKQVDGAASASDQAMLRSVSQFVGAAASDECGSFSQQWSQVRGITTWTRGSTAWPTPAALTDRNWIVFTGNWQREMPFGYNSPSNVARLMFHETGHVWNWDI